MGFAPKKSSGNGLIRNYPTPKAGNRPARVSLIIDLGIQDRKDFEDPATGEVKRQKPTQQIAISLDLTNDVVDYGGDVGNQPYRLLLNKHFNGDMEGINFTAIQPRDAEGNALLNKPWTYHPTNVITKLAKAVGADKILNGDDLSLDALLDKPLMVEVIVRERESGKFDEQGKPIIFKNVNYGALASVPEIDDGVYMSVKPCEMQPQIITFENVTLDSVKYIRADIRRKIKSALNYHGSKMQHIIDEFEAMSSNAAKTKLREQKEVGEIVHSHPGTPSPEEELPF